MKRAYTRTRYLEKVAMVRDAIPDVAVTTDIIVGFPGETEADFEQTLSLVEEASYDQAYTFQYSSRPMTDAADMPDHLPKEVVQERFERLVALQERISLERNQALVGRAEEVLVEGSSKKDSSKATGRTRTNRLVHFAAPGSVEGSFRKVRITAAHPHHLDAVALDEPSTDGVRRTAAGSMSLPLVGAASGCETCS
jgi:tRNA-2-methylthio-N6-dimethylallyladenosine synthase